MAFNSTSGKAEYIASSGQTVFTFLFKIYEETDLKVYQTPSGKTPDDTADLLTLTTDYTVTINGDAGGEITLVSGAAVSDTLVLERDLPVTRDTEYQTSGDLLAETLNEDQDYQTYLVSDRHSREDVFLKLPDTDVNMSSSLPTSIANYGLFVNDAGTAFEYRVADATGGALKAWESEANSLTSASYATQIEDTFVDDYSSDGDGSFTATPTTDYSALHWAAKAATFNPALYEIISGSNANGEYIKFADGTMICSGTISGTVTITAQVNQFGDTSGNTYKNTKTITFPIEFVGDRPIVTMTSKWSIWTGLDSDPTLTSAVVLFYAIANTQTVYTDWIAIGRWK